MKCASSMLFRSTAILAALAASIAILDSGTALASYDFVTQAVRDRIGYRSNLIDPRNPYSSDEVRNFRILLARLNLLGERTATSGDAEYEGDPRDLYLAALTRALPPHEMRAKLIAAREALPTSPSGAEIKQFLVALEAIEGKRWRPWRDYLEGALYFYAEDYDAAEEAFARVPQTDTWLGATSAYMLVRNGFWRFEEHRWARYWSEDKAEAERTYESSRTKLVRAIDGFERSGLDHGYLFTVANLKRFAAVSSGDPAEISQAYDDVISHGFTPGPTLSGLLEEFNRRSIWNEALGVEGNNPIWQVNRLLAALVQADDAAGNPWFDWKRKKFRGNRSEPGPTLAVDDTSERLSDWLASRRAAFDEFPGFYTYSRILLAFARKDYPGVVTTVSEITDAGPFMPDILVLKARSQAAMSDYWGASMTWRHIAHRWPALNALSDAARAAAKADRFSEFASLDWDLGAQPVQLDQIFYWEDEMEDPALFLKQARPIRRLLREGLARFADLRGSVEIARDADAPPLLRWYALEPVLRTSLLEENYPVFVSMAETLSDVARGIAGRKQRGLANRYLDMLPPARTLVDDPDDPNGLMTVGYFIYRERLFPACHEDDATLWSRELGTCRRTDSVQRPSAVPIELLERARDMFAQRETRAESEARVLRTMIYCFQSTPNRRKCVRDSGVGAEKKTRAGWFARLHRHFPEAAARTPHWY